MENRYLIVVDMQNDFVDGSLGTAEAQNIVPAVLEKIKNFPGQILFTQDTHQADYLSTQEGKFLPVEHCIRDTPGWELVPELKQFQEENGLPVYEKSAFASVELAEDLRDENRQTPITDIELIGLCTDICVVSNALMIKGFLPEVPVRVDASCCAGVTPEKHAAALETMASCQVEVLY